MTRAAKNCLVLDGHEVKLRLQAERSRAKTPVHVDWFRFTVPRRRSPTPSVDRLFPLKPDPLANVWEEDYRMAQINQMLSMLADCDFEASAQAWELAETVAAAIGPEFGVAVEMRKGHDFYRHRWSIERNSTECGWVGFLSSDTKHASQSATLHVNLYGAACTFAAPGWHDRLADIVEAREGVVTRCDLALDFFDGLAGGLDAVVDEYLAGACDVYGKRPKSNCVGDWLNGVERSLYIGSKAAGKQTNVYEKGHQLFGVESGSKWLRIELRYGNKLRVLPVDMLRNPASFFAGASEWHRLALLKAECDAAPEVIMTKSRLAIETVQAEVNRNLRWASNTAGPTLAAAFKYLGEDAFLQLVTNKPMPGRLQKFSESELTSAFVKSFQGVQQ
jgi:phage replication initiation protein